MIVIDMAQPKQNKEFLRWIRTWNKLREMGHRQNLKILSHGAGMMTTAIGLLSCANAIFRRSYPEKYRQFGFPHKEVPIYDAIIFADTGAEPEWVYRQLETLDRVCQQVHIPVFVLKSIDLYDHYIENFGNSRTIAIPFWTWDKEHKKRGRLRRSCTLDLKVKIIQNFIRWYLLGYRKGEITKEKDKHAHEMHIGFAVDERQRIFDSKHPLFVNRFPLVEMHWDRAKCYAYSLDTWNIKTKGSACIMCPFHKNHFFWYLKEKYPADYKRALAFDEVLDSGQPNTMFYSQLFILACLKRIKDLKPEECQDAQTFLYKGQQIWNGF